MRNFLGSRILVQIHKGVLTLRRGFLRVKSYEILDNRELSRNLRILLHTLEDRERFIIETRWGFVDGEPKTLEEVAKMLNVTRERIRQIESKALRKLRHPYRSKLVCDFVGVKVYPTQNTTETLLERTLRIFKRELANKT